LRPAQLILQPEEKKCHEIQITGYFRRTDLTLYDPAAEDAKRDEALKIKTARLAATRRAVEQAMATGRDVKTATALEFLQARDDLWKELGHEGTLMGSFRSLTSNHMIGRWEGIQIVGPHF
jgi:hypothetical protein